MAVWLSSGAGVSKGSFLSGLSWVFTWGGLQAMPKNAYGNLEDAAARPLWMGWSDLEKDRKS